MFHALVIKKNGKHLTVGCDNMDEAGFCQGHEMSRKEFIKRYCNNEDLPVKKSRGIKTDTGECYEVEF